MSFSVSEVTTSITNIENNFISDGRIGNFYKYVNTKLNGSNSIAPLKSTDGQHVRPVWRLPHVWKCASVNIQVRAEGLVAM